MRDSWSIYLRGIQANLVEWRLADEGEPDRGRRRVLDISHEISLYIAPSDERAADTVIGLRALAAAAIEVADSLEASAAPIWHPAAGDTPDDCGCGLGAARCRALEDGEVG